MVNFNNFDILQKETDKIYLVANAQSVLQYDFKLLRAFLQGIKDTRLYISNWLF